MGSRKKGRLEKQKPCQDCRTLIGAGDQRPAILPWFLDVGWRPSFRGHTGTLPVAPSRRIAAGLSVGTIANTEPLVFAGHAPDAKHRSSMIRKSAKRFSEKIMLKQQSKVRFLSRFGPAPDVRVSLDQKP
jgi:hypothetical protein